MTTPATTDVRPGFCVRCGIEHTFIEDQAVEVLWCSGQRSQHWKRATVTAIRCHSLAVKPDHVRVYIEGPALGTYQVPVTQVRAAIAKPEPR